MSNSPTKPQLACAYDAHTQTQRELTPLAVPVQELYSFILDKSEILLIQLRATMDAAPAPTLSYMVRTFSTHFALLCRTMNEGEIDRLRGLVLAGLYQKIDECAGEDWKETFKIFTRKALEVDDVEPLLLEIKAAYPRSFTHASANQLSAMAYDYSSRAGVVLDEID